MKLAQVFSLAWLSSPANSTSSAGVSHDVVSGPKGDAKVPQPSRGSCSDASREASVYVREVAGRHRFPREIFLICLIGPFGLEYLLGDEAFSWTGYAQGVLANFVPFVGIPLAFYGVSKRLLPEVLARVHSGLGRVAVVSALAAAVSAAAGFVLSPLHFVFCEEQLSVGRFVVICMIIGVTLGVPVLLGMHLRARLSYEAEVRREDQRARIEAQLRELQARTNPHFLFNALNTVASLIPENPELAERTIERLASMFRYSLDNARAQLVSLERELDIVVDYLEVQRERFGRRFNFELQIDEAVKGAFLPPMSLQPLIENAVLHGVSRRARNGSILLEVSLRDDQVECTVWDNGPDRAGQGGGGGSRTSIADLKKRLRLVYGERGRIEARPIDGGGFEARLRIPFHGKVA